MSDNILPISELSTKEEVANYLSTELNLKDDMKHIILNEYITGDILPQLSEEDVAGLGFKLGPKKRINKFIAENKDKFKEKEITEKIMENSNKEEVKNFFEKCIEFTGELSNLDGKGLLELDEERMKSLGLKFGQRKRLIKYIEYFKTLKPPPDEEDKEPIISRKSTEEEVSKFLKMKLKFSQDSIDSIELDGASLFELQEKEIDELEQITTEEKENLKKFLRGELEQNTEEKEKEPEFKLDLNSTLADICNFLKKKLNFSDETISSIKEQDIDTDCFFSLTIEDMNDFKGISETEKEKLNIYLKEFREEKEGNEIKIDNKKSKEDVAKILKEKLYFSEKALKNWKLDGKSFLSLKEIGRAHV